MMHEYASRRNSHIANRSAMLDVTEAIGPVRQTSLAETAQELMTYDGRE